ncbi:N-acetyltransferase [Lactobacillus crispatus]|uniref:N-acetyltransferase n=1 Tax=Lactobacillus crispatus TaxID=47770 RepID=A0A4R6CRI0_9LACO|nr:N-acetyltransferase [Lactobacillus crispatus]TDM68424.1 N-acetyltransferase [Lactobacillus crispatus]TDM68490.1 N-acetyltransferase [Lactobacillus crispatus]TDM75215.1 N-acetyltransferase [Lactobacillus crispatus]TDM77673.1 N-acetyltransferase [Lactobacillus crispatus]
MLNPGDYQVYVATKENKVVGFVGFNEEELGWLYVDPKVQGQGIGSKLIDFTLENSTRPFYLEVLEGNPAQKLYLKKGFITIKHESGKMPGNESFSVEVDLMEYK